MRNLYTQLKEKKPSALKDLKVEIKKVETTKGEEVIVKETEKVVGKKEVTKKNPTPSSSKKETITEVAKKIRKADEPWRQALKRAGEEMRKRDDEASKQVKTELQKLVDFVKNDPNFKDFPRTYGKGRKDIDLLKDASEKALAPGRRVSQKGHMNQYGASKGGRKYTENRDNRSDREASKFPKNIFLAKGGRVHRAELMEEGGEVFVPVQILANNPDALVNTTTMTELFAEGGMAPTRKLFEDGGALYQSDMDADYITYGEVFKSGGKLKYDPARDVQAIVIQDGTLKKMFIKGDFLGGAYRLASGGLSEDYIYVSPRKVIFARLKSGEDIKPSNGFWIKKNASGTIYTGSAKAKPAFVKSKKFPLPKKITLSYPLKENDKIMKLLGEFSGKDDLRPAMTFVSIKDGELVSTNAYYLIRLMDPTTKGENELVCESKSCQNIKKTDLKYPDVNRVIESFEADFSDSYDFVDLYESLMQAREDAYEKLQRRSKNTFIVTNVEFKNNDIAFDSGILLQALKGAISLGMQKGFISYSEAENRAIVLTPSKVTTDSKYRVLGGKDLILVMPVMGSKYEFESTIVAKQVDIMEAGMNETKQVTKKGTYSFPEGQVVWDLGNKTYGVVLNNFGDPKNGKQGEIRLDSDGIQSIYDYPDTSKYNLVPIGSPEDRGDGNVEEGKSAAKRIINLASSEEQKNDYKRIYKDLLNGKFDKFKKMADGGEVYVPVQMLANNPDALVNTTTMSELFENGGMVNPLGYSVEWSEDNENFQREFFDTLDEAKNFFRFIIRENEYGYKMPISLTSLKDGEILMGQEFAKGGYVDVQANLMKELQKLQRELNSPRLSRYTEGDNSQEEIARKRERASKLNRFNEILDLLRELESKKMADGGLMAKGGRTKGDVGRSGTQYGYTLKEYDEIAEKNGLFVSPKEWWSSRKGKKYTDSFGRTKTIGNNAQDERQEMQAYGYRIAIGMDLGSNKIPASAKKYVEDNNLMKADGGTIPEGYHQMPDGGKLEILNGQTFNAIVSDVRKKTDLSRAEIYSLIEDFESRIVLANNKEKMAEGGFVAIYNGKKINIEADSLYAAKLKAIEELKVPKSKQGLLSVVSNKSMANQDFRFMAHGGQLEAQSLEMAQNISTQIAHHAEELKDALNGKKYVEPWVTSMLQRAADNLSDATHYLEGKEEKMAKGGKLRNGKENYEKGDEGMYEGNEVRVVKLDTELVKYEYDVLDEDGNVKTHGLAPKDKFERQFAYFPKMAKGGYVAVAEKDDYWYIISTPSSKENSQKLLDMTTLSRGEVGKVVTIDEAKAYNKVIGREYLEKDAMMAKGGKIREWDDVYIISKNKLGMVELILKDVYYVTTPFGETFQATIDDIRKIERFDKGGEVMVGEIASIAKENEATGDEVVKKISKGADVEMEHTEDRKVAMRIAVDHLKEDFNYYEKLRKAGL
jgi:hypothetical protein